MDGFCLFAGQCASEVTSLLVSLIREREWQSCIVDKIVVSRTLATLAGKQASTLPGNDHHGNDHK